MAGQNFVRSIALDEIAGVQFVDGDIHRQIITGSRRDGLRESRRERLAGGGQDAAAIWVLRRQWRDRVKHRENRRHHRRAIAPSRTMVLQRSGFGPRANCDSPTGVSVEYLVTGVLSSSSWQAQEPARRTCTCSSTSPATGRTVRTTSPSRAAVASPGTSQWTARFAWETTGPHRSRTVRPG